MSKFHAIDGWYFERLSDGRVHVVVQPKLDEAPVTDIIFDESSWCSIIASVSPTGDNGNTFPLAAQLHDAERALSPPGRQELVDRAWERQRDGEQITPLVIERHESDGVHWGVSITSPNPEPIDYYECHGEREAANLAKQIKATSALRIP